MSITNVPQSALGLGRLFPLGGPQNKLPVTNQYESRASH